MDVLHLLTLIVLGGTWWLGLKIGFRLCRSLGVVERASQWALACIVPTAGLIVAVHFMAIVSLLTGRGTVWPETVAAIFALVTWLAHVWTRRAESRRPARESLPCTDERPIARLWVPVAIVTGTYGVFLLDALTRFPMGYDALYYHLPVAVRWMQERQLNLVVGFNYLSHPENGMIVPFLLSFGNLESLFPLVHLPKGLLIGIVIYGLARSLNVGRGAATLASCIALSVPIVTFQSFSGYIDLYAAAAWLSALLALTWAARAPDRFSRNGLLLLAGLSAGVALGSKTTYLVMVGMLVLVSVAVEWIRPRESAGDRRRPLRNLIVFAAATLACSGFWFVRGTVQAGNPIYPLGVKIGNTAVLQGLTADDVFPQRPMRETFERWWAYPWRETKHSGTGYPYSVNNGVGAAFTAFVPLGLLAAGVSLSRWRRRDLSALPRPWLSIFVLLCLTGMLLLMTVFREMLRFVLPLLLLSVPVAGVLLERLLARFPRPVFATLVIALAVTGTIASAKPARSFVARVKNSVVDRAFFYGIPSVIDELPAGSRIVNTADPGYNYPLLGKDLSNTLIDAGMWQTKLCPQGVTAQALRENRADYIFVQEPWPSDWPDDLPIELIGDNSDRSRRPGVPASRIYRVLPDDHFTSDLRR